MTPEQLQIARCIQQSTAARGVDYWAVDVCGLTAQEWGDATGRDASTVGRNVRRAREDIEESD